MTKEKVMEIIKKVEDFEIELDNTLDPDYYEVEFIDGPKNTYFVQQVEGYPELELFFAEFDHVKEVNRKVYTGEMTPEEADDFYQGLNELADQFDFDNVVAYRSPYIADIQWLK